MRARSSAGRCGAGSVDGTAPNREPIVATSSFRIAASAAVTATATSSPGHFGRMRLSPRMIASARAERPTAAGFTVPSAAQMACSFGSSAAGSLAMSRPRSSRSWLAKMMTPMPAVKPTVTGKGMYLMYVPSRRKPAAIMTRPAMAVASTSPS